MKEHAIISSGPLLVERYESLRQDGVEWSGRGRTLNGRAVLRFKGMAVWMRCVSEAAPSPTPVTVRGASRLPAGIEQNLIQIVATMTLATARESLS